MLPTKFSLCVFLIFIICHTKAQAEQAPLEQTPLVVLASIKPLALLIEEYLGEELNRKVELHTILSGQESPHHFALKSSHARLLSKADLLFWVGPDFELFLQRSARSVTNIAMKPHKDDDHDLHLWLDINAVQVMMASFQEWLIQQRPSWRNHLQERMHVFNNNMTALHQNLKQAYEPMQNIHFVVFHEAYGPLIEAYGLSELGHLTSVPDEQVSARQLAEFARHHASQAKCLLTAIGEERQAERYAKVLKLPVVIIDLLASEHQFDSYSHYMLGIAKQINQCR